MSLVQNLRKTVYFTNRGIGGLGERRGEEQVTLGWLAARLTAFADLYPDFDVGSRVVIRWRRPSEERLGAGWARYLKAPGRSRL